MTDVDADEVSSVPEPPPGSSLAVILRIPSLLPLLVSSLLWHTSRWASLFACAYLLTQISDVAFYNQLAGAFIFLPMLFGGIAAGSFSDRVDRRRLVFRTQLVLIPVTLLMFVVVQSGWVRVWMVFPFMLAAGCGAVVNMTAQRPLLYETAGRACGARVLTVESVGAGTASILGPVLGGALIAAFGMGSVFLLPLVTLCLSASLLVRIGRVHRRAAPALRIVIAERHPLGRLRLLRESPPLASMLGVTVLMNLFYFTFVPLVPVMAQRFESGALSTGVLVAAAGMGQLAAGLLISVRHVNRRGRLYVVGTAISIGGLGLFSFSPVFGLAFLALVFAGAGQAGFGTMQSVLAIESVSDAERGAAQGLLSTAIGALPLGMLVLGLTAEVLGTQLALLSSSALGLVTLTVWLSKHPQVLKMTARTI